MRDEAGAYQRVDNLRVADVTEAWLLRPNPLYRPRRIDVGKIYHRDDIPKVKYRSVDDALAAVRHLLRYN
jgi:hypothetical protein